MSLSRRLMAPIRRLSSTVRSVNVPRPWGTWAMPRRDTASGPLPAIDTPSKRKSPATWMTPLIARRVVVLPAPFAPSTTTTWPSSTARSMSWSTRTGP